MKYLTISTEAINFDPQRFDKEIRSILYDHTIVGVEILPEKESVGYLISFKLK